MAADRLLPVVLPILAVLSLPPQSQAQSPRLRSRSRRVFGYSGNVQKQMLVRNMLVRLRGGEIDSDDRALMRGETIRNDDPFYSQFDGGGETFRSTKYHSQSHRSDVLSRIDPTTAKDFLRQMDLPVPKRVMLESQKQELQATMERAKFAEFDPHRDAMETVRMSAESGTAGVMRISESPEIDQPKPREEEEEIDDLEWAEKQQGAQIVEKKEEEEAQGFEGAVLNPGTFQEKILPPVPPPGLTAEEEEAWLEAHPTPKSNPFLAMQQELREVDEQELREKLERKRSRKAKKKDLQMQAQAGGAGGGDDGDDGAEVGEDSDPNPENWRTIDIRFETSLGNFDVELYFNHTPANSHFFGTMVNTGFYNGLKFHRKIHNWIIQGGDPTGTGEGGEVKGIRIPNEAQPALRHTGPGIIGLAGNDGPVARPNTQFYITLGPTPPLDGKYCILGRVSNGIDAIENMARLPVDREDKPQQLAQIYKAYVLRGHDLLQLSPPKLREVDEKEEEKDYWQADEIRRQARRRRKTFSKKKRKEEKEEEKSDGDTRFINNLATVIEAGLGDSKVFEQVQLSVSDDGDDPNVLDLATVTDRLKKTAKES